MSASRDGDQCEIRALARRHGHWLVAGLIFASSMGAYGLTAEAWSGVRFHTSQARLEIPLLGGLFLLIYGMLRPGRRSALIASLPFLIGYLVADAYFAFYGKALRLVDLRLAPEGFAVISSSAQLALIAVAALSTALLAVRLDLRRYNALAFRATALLGVLGLPLLAPQVVRSTVEAGAVRVGWFSDAKNVWWNGRLVMALYHEAGRQARLAQMEGRLDRSDLPERFARLTSGLRPHVTGRNVHVIVLESLLDPTLFASLRLQEDPADPAFRKLVERAGSFSIAPVIGGLSAQSEFEVLCGVPARAAYSGVEFLAMTGARTFCVPQLLAELGYETVASNAFKPNFYNSTNAYRSIGFGRMYFPREYAPGSESYLSLGGTREYMFDGLLLEQNLAFLRSRDRAKPVFNYVLGVFGHAPFDLEGLPAVVESLPDRDDPELLRLVNQFHHRSRAVARYVAALTRLDPQSLILVTSDHTPPIGARAATYADLGYLENQPGAMYMNRLIVIENGRPVRLPTLRHHDLATLMMDYVTGGGYCEAVSCPTPGSTPGIDALERYRDIISHASR